MADGTHRIRLIAGLGNPDSKYEGTRHNAGFMFSERLLTRLPRSFQRIHGFQSYYWKGTYAGAPLIVQTPFRPADAERRDRAGRGAGGP